MSSRPGAILNSVPKDDEPSSLDFAGSTLIMVAETKEEVIKALNDDIYATEGVWDVEKVGVHQLTFTRRALTVSNRLRFGP